MGHNLGADHANLWRAATTTGPGWSQEYYDFFGVMGIGSSDGRWRFLLLLSLILAWSCIFLAEAYSSWAKSCPFLLA